MKQHQLVLFHVDSGLLFHLLTCWSSLFHCIQTKHMPFNQMNDEGTSCAASLLQAL